MSDKTDRDDSKEQKRLRQIIILLVMIQFLTPLVAHGGGEPTVSLLFDQDWSALQVKAVASADVVRVEFYVDQTLVLTSNSPKKWGPYQNTFWFDIDPSWYPAGDHVIRVVAYTSTGEKTSTEATRHFTGYEERLQRIAIVVAVLLLALVLTLLVVRRYRRTPGLEELTRLHDPKLATALSSRRSLDVVRTLNDHPQGLAEDDLLKQTTNAFTLTDLRAQLKALVEGKAVRLDPSSGIYHSLVDKATFRRFEEAVEKDLGMFPERLRINFPTWWPSWLPWHHKSFDRYVSQDSERSRIVMLLRGRPSGMTMAELEAELKRSGPVEAQEIRNHLGGLQQAGVIELKGQYYRTVKAKTLAVLLWGLLLVLGCALGIYLLFQAVSWILR